MMDIPWWIWAAVGVLLTCVVFVVTSDPTNWREVAAAWQQRTARLREERDDLLVLLAASRQEAAQWRVDAVRLQCVADQRQRILHDTESPTLPVPVVLLPGESLEPLALHTWMTDELN